MPRVAHAEAVAAVVISRVLGGLVAGGLVGGGGDGARGARGVVEQDRAFRFRNAFEHLVRVFLRRTLISVERSSNPPFLLSII